MNEGDPLPIDMCRVAPATFVGEVVMKTEVTPFLRAAKTAAAKPRSAPTCSSSRSRRTWSSSASPPRRPMTCERRADRVLTLRRAPGSHPRGSTPRDVRLCNHRSRGTGVVPDAWSNNDQAVGIIGGGIMGCGIAEVAARSGCDVVLARGQSGAGRCRAAPARVVAGHGRTQGELTVEERDDIVKRVRFTDSWTTSPIATWSPKRRSRTSTPRRRSSLPWERSSGRTR